MQNLSTLSILMQREPSIICSMLGNVTVKEHKVALCQPANDVSMQVSYVVELHVAKITVVYCAYTRYVYV